MMTQELPLLTTLRDAWNRCRDDYNEGLINSERSLQAAFCFHLRTSFGDTQSRIFIEPHLKIEGQSLYPDIVVCDAFNVLGVVEIKFKPRKLPRFQNDLRKLGILYQSKENHLLLKRERYLGPLQNTNYRFSNTVVFAWAGIHCASEDYPRKLKTEARNQKIDDNFFLQLHLETSEDFGAKIPAELE